MEENSQSKALFSNPVQDVPSSQQIPYSGRNDVSEPDPTTHQLFDQDSGASCLSGVDQTNDQLNQESIDMILSFRKNSELDETAFLLHIEAEVYRVQSTFSSMNEEEFVSLTFSAPPTKDQSADFVMSQTRTEIDGLTFILPEPMISSTAQLQFQSAQPLRIPLSLADRDQLRAMIVMLNESNSVLLKLRHRFPLSAPTRCDVIQRQIQIQLQELFGEFRRNDVELFRSKISQNREIFLIIWNQIAHLVTELCYHP